MSDGQIRVIQVEGWPDVSPSPHETEHKKGQKNAKNAQFQTQKKSIRLKNTAQVESNIAA